MSNESSSEKKCGLALVLWALIALTAIFHIGSALKGHGRYRDQHIGTALHYAATQFDLQHTIIPGFNASDSPTIQELPVWQMATGLMFKLFGTWWGWANIVSLLLFFSALYPLFAVVKQFYGDRIAWWALIFFLSQGLIFLYAGEAGTDGFCLAVSLWFWFACVRLLASPVKWFLPAALLGALTAVSKLPFFMAVGLAAFFLLLKERGFKVRDLAALAGVGGFAGVSFLAWTHYTDALQAEAAFRYVDLRLNAPATNGTTMWFWYFGDWHYRLNPGNWIKAAWRFAGAGFGSFTLIVLFAGALWWRGIHPAAKFLLAGSFLVTLVFTHLILHHYNYLMLYSPAVAILGAAGWGKIESALLARKLNPCLVTGTATLILLLALFQGLTSMKAFTFDYFPAMITTAIREHTSATDKIIVVNGGWGGDELTRAGRGGLSMWNVKAFEDAAQAAQLKKLGYNKLIIVSQSPYQNAVQIINPGQTAMPRIMAKQFLTPLAETWPTVYATDDLIIKDIP
jgi:hypothetical protein